MDGCVYTDVHIRTFFFQLYDTYKYMLSWLASMTPYAGVLDAFRDARGDERGGPSAHREEWSLLLWWPDRIWVCRVLGLIGLRLQIFGDSGISS